MSEIRRMDDTLDLHVHSPSKGIGKGHLSDDSDSDYSAPGNLWEEESCSSSVSSVESSRYDVSKLEAYLYYFGIRGDRRRGPKLIFRTSKDVFAAPSGEQRFRSMWLLPVYEHHQLGQGNLWAIIRYKVVELLDKRNIRHSSIDLVRFSWIEENKDIKVSLCRTVVTTPVTIWVGVLPDTLAGEVAFHSSNDILDLLKEHGIYDIDVAYRESVVRAFSGPELFEPVSNDDPLKAVIDPVTTALGLPIASLKTLDREGTLGFYFRVAKDLYAVTARHVLFKNEEGNHPYNYPAGPRKEVVLMGTNAFANFLTSIEGHINTIETTVQMLGKRVAWLTASAEGGGPNAEQAASKLVGAQHQLVQARAAIDKLKIFDEKVKKQWTKPEDRIIGQVVWAPPISVSTSPHGYTKDICVIKLNKKKFSRNFRSNVIDLGPEIDVLKFENKMCPRNDTPCSFHYPANRLLRLRGILSAEEMRNNGPEDGHIRYVIKRGLATHTTIGRLAGFESHVRIYSALGSRDSVEAAVYPSDNKSGPFSQRGDSGSIIVDALGRFVALLTGGAGETESTDITYGSPMYWLWPTIKAKFSGANLYFDNDYN